LLSLNINSPTLEDTGTLADSSRVISRPARPFKCETCTGVRKSVTTQDDAFKAGALAAAVLGQVVLDRRCGDLSAKRCPNNGVNLRDAQAVRAWRNQSIDDGAADRAEPSAAVWRSAEAGARAPALLPITSRETLEQGRQVVV